MIPKVATEAFHWIFGITPHHTISHYITVVYLIIHSLHETSLDHSQYRHSVFSWKIFVGKRDIHLGLKHVHFLHGAGVRLADDGDDVDLLVDLLHHLHVQGLQSVAGGRYEVETGVDPLVSDIKPAEERLSD